MAYCDPKLANLEGFSFEIMSHDELALFEIGVLQLSTGYTYNLFRIYYDIIISGYMQLDFNEMKFGPTIISVQITATLG